MPYNSTSKFYIFLAVLAVTLCGFSFFLGYKFQSFRVKSEGQDQLIISTLKEIEQDSNDINKANINTQALDISNVYWLAIDAQPVCPDTHIIKGKAGQVNYYYTPDNTFYNRVKPNICFSSEEYAKDIAKFIKKY
jgi:hypothetical protein